MSTTEQEKEQEWPSLVEESRDLLVASILMYGISSLRSLARENKLNGGDEVKKRILDLPFTIKDVLDLAADNKQVLQESFSEQESKMYGTALEPIRKDIEKEKAGERGITAAAQVVAFDDEHGKNELVYGISVNARQKRVTVAFRGSQTPRDFMVDADGSFHDLDNPLDPDSKVKLGLHHGFFEYLNGNPRRRSGVKGDEEEEVVNKYTQIMRTLEPIFMEHPDYRLYCTGHSLGASLAILFAVEAAGSTSYSIPKPVTCINFASPKVGNVHFRSCFQSLEVEGKIRCLRFVNAGDLIPTLPDRQNCSFCRTIRCQPSVYRHCGPKVILHVDGYYEVAYEKDDTETVWRFIREVRYTFGHGIGFVLMIPALLRFKNFFVNNHGCGTYLDRFNKAFANSDIYLNDIYKQELKVLKLKGKT